MDLNLHSEGRDHHDNRHHVAFAEASHRSAERVAAPRPVAAHRHVATTIDSGWYHDAAIETARQNAIEARCNPYR